MDSLEHGVVHYVCDHACHQRGMDSLVMRIPQYRKSEIDHLVRLIESAIHSQDGKMTLDIQVDDELRDTIRNTLKENREWCNSKEYAVECALRKVFLEHEVHMTQAAIDDVNMGLRRALDFIASK